MLQQKLLYSVFCCNCAVEEVVSLSLNSMASIKKDIERFYLEEFIRAFNWNASIISAGNDSGKEPDFFVDLAGEKVGVEITQLFKKKNRKGNPEKAVEKHNESFLSHLADTYYGQSSIPINISLLSRNALQFDSIPGLAVKLAIESERLIDKQKMRIEFDNSAIAHIQRLPESFRKYRRWTFVNDHVGFSKPINIAILNEAIVPKYQKIINYKAAVNKVLKFRTP